MPSPYRQKWIVAGAMGMLGYVVWGVGFYALPVFYVPLKTEFGWTRVELTSIGVFTILLYSLSGPAIGTLIDTRGIRKVVIGGLTLFGLSLAFFAVSAKTLRAFYLVGAVFGVACACLSLLPSQVLVVQWFEQKRATAMGFVLTLMGLGGAVNASLAGSLIGRVGWRHTALIFDLLVWIFALPLGLSLIKERIPAEPCKPEQGSVGTGGVTLSQAARSPQFYLLCSAVFLNMAVGNAVLANIVLHIFELGHGLRFATSVMSLLVLANLIARPVIGNISDWTSIRFGALLSFGCLGLSVFVLLLAKSK